MKQKESKSKAVFGNTEGFFSLAERGEKEFCGNIAIFLLFIVKYNDGKREDFKEEYNEQKIAFTSLGCDKNRVDSEVMLGILQKKRLHSGGG